MPTPLGKVNPISKQLSQIEETFRTETTNRKKKDLADLIAQIKSDISFEQDQISQRVGQNYASRNITGPFVAKQIADAQRSGTAGLNRTLLRLLAEQSAFNQQTAYEERVRQLVDNRTPSLRPSNPTGQSGLTKQISQTAPTAVLLGNKSGEYGLNINIPGAGGGTRTIKGSLGNILDEIKKLQKRGVQVISEGSLPDVEQESFQSLTKAGVIPTAKHLAEKLLLGRSRASIGKFIDIAQIGNRRQRPSLASQIADEIEGGLGRGKK